MDPTNLSKRTKIVLFVAGAVVAALFLYSLATADAEELQMGPDEHISTPHIMVHDPEKSCQLGSYLCDHEKFHPIYQLLELLTGESCCHNSEGRPTKDIKDATPGQVNQGFRYQAWIDGQWCPVSESALMRISEEQRTQFMRYKRINPELFYQFLEHDHAFAPESQIDGNGKKICPTVFCIYKKMGNE